MPDAAALLRAVDALPPGASGPFVVHDEDERWLGALLVVGDDGEPVLVGERDAAPLGLAGLAELGGWATAALEVTRGFSAAAMARILAAIDGRAALAWRASRRVVHALVIDDPRALARAI